MAPPRATWSEAIRGDGVGMSRALARSAAQANLSPRACRRARAVPKPLPWPPDSPMRPPFEPFPEGFGARFHWLQLVYPAPISRALPVRNCKRWLRFMQIIVRDNNVEQALRALKKKLQREGV